MDSLTPTPRPRRRKIEEICQAAINGIETEMTDFSSTELCCGVLTLSLRTISSILALHPECADQMRLAVMPLLMACTDPAKKGN